MGVNVCGVVFACVLAFLLLCAAKLIPVYVLFVEDGDLRVLYCNVCVTKVLVRSTSIHDRDWVVLICVLVAGV